MLPRSDLLTVLAGWNRWGGGSLPSGRRRRVLARLEPFLHSREIVGLVGPRRAGKTTVLYQLMDLLQAGGLPPEALLHVNLEEPGLSPFLDEHILDGIYEIYRQEVYPEGRPYVFLDEVQRVPGWERWARARTEREGIKVFVTGSSSGLMSRELSTLLTGRHVTFRVMPLDFAEYLEFREVPIPRNPRLDASPPRIQHALLDYMRWGGFPEIVLAVDDSRKSLLLKTYFDDVLFKDVALRHEIRDLRLLRTMAVHLLTQTSSLISLRRLSHLLEVSLDLARACCDYLEEAFLVEFLTFFSLKTADRVRRPRKVHAVDTGLRNAICLGGAPDRGRLAETMVHNAVKAREDAELYYWQDTGEVDLLIRRANRVEALIQVALEGMEQEDVARRELRALDDGMKAFPGATRHVITLDGRPSLTGDVKNIPLWRFLALPE